MNKSYYVCSYEPQPVCPMEIFINIPSNKKINVNLIDFIIADRDHLNIDKSCKTIIINALPGESKTIYIKGMPSNWVDKNSRIVCSS